MRYVRSLLLALTTFAFFLLVLVAGLYAFITPERVSARMTGTLSQHLGLTIKMTGLRIDTRLPNLKFTITDADLAGADGAVRGSVPTATITLHPLALFTRSPRISEITISDASLTFGDTSPEDVRNWIESTIKPLAFDVERLVVHRGAVYLSSHQTGSEPWAYINNASASISNLSEAGAAYSLSGVIKLPEMLGSANLRGITDWSQGLLAAKSEQLSATFKGEVRGRRTEFSGRADKIALTRSSSSLANLSVSLKCSDDALLELSAPSLTIGGHVLDAPALSAALTLTSADGVRTLTASTVLKADLFERRFDIPAISVSGQERLSGAQASSSTGTLTGRLFWNAANGEGRAELNGTLQGASATLDLSLSNAVPFTADQALFPHRFAAIPRISGRVVLGEIPLKTIVNLAKSATLLHDVDTSIDFNIMLKAPYIDGHETSGRLVAGAGKAFVIDGGLKLANAVIPFDAECDSDGVWRIRSNWRNAEARDLLPSILSGPISGTLEACGLLKDASQTTASIRLEARDGEFHGADLELASKIMHDVQPEALPTGAFLRSSRTAFTTLSCNLGLDNGVWTIANGEAEGKHWKSFFTGAYGHIDTRIDFSADNGAAFFTMPARIQTDPILWTPDWRAALASALEHVGELPWSIDNLQERLRQELENWWNNLDASEFKLPEFNAQDFSLPDFTLPNIELPEWANKFLGKERAPENPAPATATDKLDQNPVALIAAST